MTCLSPIPLALIVLIPVLGVALLLGGCQGLPMRSRAHVPGRIEALPVAGPVTVGGHLNEAAWAKAKPIPFQLVASAADRKRIGEVEGKGSARLLHDDKNLYIAFAFEDADVVDRSAEDDQEVYTMSDVAEIFLKPTDEAWYWEFHVTPKGRVSTYWWPGGEPPKRAEEHHVKPRFIQVAAQVQGTINHSEDRDQGWTALVTIPFAKLDRFGPPKDPNGRWTILLSRYNYSRYRMKGTGPELSAASPLSEPNYHLVEEYPRLHLRK